MDSRTLRRKFATGESAVSPDRCANDSASVIVTRAAAITYAMKPIGSFAKSITERTGVGISRASQQSCRPHGRFAYRIGASTAARSEATPSSISG
jgi:hypothetical protein